MIQVDNQKARPGKTQEERLICMIDRPTNQPTNCPTRGPINGHTNGHSLVKMLEDAHRKEATSSICK